MDQVAGSQGFRWFIGIVEAIEGDPMQLGRVKVRIIHEYDEGIETDDIDWAHIMLPTTSECVGGVGDTPSLAVGSNVIGFFLDAQSKQQMMILGSFPTIPGMEDDKHSLSFLARGKQNIEKELIGPEPESAFGAEYPNNRVIQTKAGHVIELDNTPENERIHIYHKAGTYIEINNEGRMVTKSAGDNYLIVKQNHTVYIEGDVDVEVKGNVKILVSGDANIEVNGTTNVTCPQTNVEGDVFIDGKLRVTGNVNVESDVLVDGQVTAQGDVRGEGISLSKHRHGGVQSGGSQTSPPT